MGKDLALVTKSNSGPIKYGAYNFIYEIEIIPCDYAQIKGYGKIEDSLFLVSRDYVAVAGKDKEQSEKASWFLLNLKTNKEVSIPKGTKLNKGIERIYDYANNGYSPYKYSKTINIETGKNGLFEIETGKVILPAEYDKVALFEYAYENGDKFYVQGIKGNTKTIFDNKGNAILSLNENQKVSNGRGYFAVDTKDGSQTKREYYTLKGVKYPDGAETFSDNSRPYFEYEEGVNLKERTLLLKRWGIKRCTV